MPRGTHDRLRSPIDVELRPSRFPMFAGVVALRGEHDLATASLMADALASVSGDVLVDFSECSFCDSSVVDVLFEAGTTREREGHHLALLVPRTNRAVARVFEITGLPTRVSTHTDRERINAEPAASTAP